VIAEKRAGELRAVSGDGPSLVGKLLILVLRGYGLWISPYFGANCRFHPSCSRYAMEAVEAHGALRGGWLAVRRLGRCHPFHAGGLDPVP
jgi:putative membrane protein insertion efficiency factor